MNYLDLTLPTVAENLALDEVLLDQFATYGNLLRLWEAKQTAVVVGRGSRVDREVDRQQCDRAGISIHRRCSGGAAVVIGPGCLMYAVVLATHDRPELNVIDRAHRFVLERLRTALQGLDVHVTLSGTSDLTCAGRKFSGNSLRCRRDSLLYHGTLLYDADIALIETCLTMPPKQPDYRQQRPHHQFLTNLPVTQPTLRQALTEAWECRETLQAWPNEATARRVHERYARSDWNFLR